MRGLSLVDVVIMLAVLAVLLFAGSKEFARYNDLTIAPAGAGTVLTMAGSYRPPLGSLGEVLDRAILHRVATTTIRSFLAQVAAQLANQPITNGAGSATG